MAQSTDLWNNADQAKTILKEQADNQNTVAKFSALDALLGDAVTALDLVKEGGGSEFLKEAQQALAKLEGELEKQEFVCKMRGEFDSENAIMEINSGSGGTEAQDWAEMLLRMYIRWAERKGFEIEELDYQAGEGAGIKRCALSVRGPYVYGLLRCERGVHRLVRISPFDANARRHTSFASVSVIPDIDREIEIEVDEKDLRVDTYRSSGKGGQHVNRTDSAVRLTHIPTGLVVACQNERSQHKNKDRAMKVLKMKLYDLKRQEQDQKFQQIHGERKKIDFGSQIRSYVLQPYQLIKDVRTDYETSSVNEVLDGDLDGFIEAYLLSDVNVG
jgi:peptide chain release factor 2